jgi:hypothetical protein
LTFVNKKIYSKKHIVESLKTMTMSAKKKTKRKKYKTLLDENDKGKINVIEPSSADESLKERLQKGQKKK